MPKNINMDLLNKKMYADTKDTFSTIMSQLFSIILALIIFGIVISFNSLISRKNKVDYAFGGLDAMLKKRSDLVPNLVSTVKGYMNHEKEVLENITKLRSEVTKENNKIEKRFEDEQSMALLLQKVVVSVENYPDLKANQNFMKLQEALNEVEEQISAGRRAYNAAIFDYNNGIEMFPLSIVARFLSYQKKDFFKATEEEKVVPSTKIL